ncbi:MAG TPA: pyruvate kinase [Alphaproteobacteria bacterium]|nr:pyruvate kinase [Alphaproteobacteria bacterium]
MRRQRNSKIIATLGPATSSEAMIAKLFKAGADLFRLNLSHGTQSDHRRAYRIIRRLEKKYKRPIGIIADLQGPKLRVGEFEGGEVFLKNGQRFRLDLEDELGNESRVTLPHLEIFAALKPKMDLLLDDGKIRLRVLRRGAKFADTKVITGGELSDHKGVNVPSAVLDLSPLTPKDKKDLRFSLGLGVDWVALSFVQRPEDIEDAKKIIKGKAGILAKLEKPSAINHLEEIVCLADAIMVARGDLGVEVAPEDVPTLQKQIIHACRQKGRPVVVATQMLDSMVHAPMPTRAEASDVATAVYDGADAVMLSAETAVGEYPVQSVSMMERIIKRVERDRLYAEIRITERRLPEATSSDAITAAARQVAQTISAEAIVTFTSSGSTTLRAARERPTVPILGLTPIESTARRLTLTWGVHSVRTRVLHSFREMVDKAGMVAKRDEFAQSGGKLVVTAGVPFGTPGTTNILRIAKVK